MNGLKMIRIRCNLSLNDLANILGVTRQALNSWENEKKEIPEARKKQLSEYFGLDEKYFGEISEKDEIDLVNKAMFRYDVNGKEAYRYKPEQDYESLESIGMYFWKKREMSLEDEYILAKKRKQETLDEIDDLIKWKESKYRIDHIGLIHRGCDTYGMINSLLQKHREMKRPIRVPFFYELRNVWKAMQLAYGLIDKSELYYRNGKDDVNEDGVWILELSEILKAHWEEEKSYWITREKEKKAIRESEKVRKNNNTVTPLTVREQIRLAEEDKKIHLKAKKL